MLFRKILASKLPVYMHNVHNGWKVLQYITNTNYVINSLKMKTILAFFRKFKILRYFCGFA